MWPAFPAADYYGPSAPTQRQQPATRLPDDRRSGRGGGRRVGSHVRSRSVRRVRRPAMPLRPRHAYPAALRHGLPAGDINRRGSSPHKAGTHRNPAPIRQVRAGGLFLRGVQTLVSHVHLPVTLAGPRPSDGAGPSRRCRGCFQPPGASPPVGLPSASPARCDEPEAVSFHHRTIRERLVALVGSGRGAAAAFRPLRFPGPPSEPDVHVSAHPALHGFMAGVRVILGPRSSMGSVSECLGSGSG
jgi:hypothetical protein